ncbi:hypothetical protein [Mycobacterium sp. OTB74]|uniref:NACHT domain-containing protein n=1 Tax=Mycobacterium sp. OTB74 TaxID=1853452 RepID=UPI0024746D79|nr:hypothetical protein [Mycobacterium sp. OTB74]MDH6247258.1 hypothetical protein [Mycobacterium sp. OTB74]
MIGVELLHKLAAGLAKRLWREARPDISETALNANADKLALAVWDQETVLSEQLGGGRNMVIDDLEFRAEARSWLAASDEAGTLADIGPYYRRQDSRRLVVQGEPGAGKTVTLVHFVLDQLDHRKTLTESVRANEPVPVRVNAAGWDGSADLTRWLANQLAINYGLNPRVARAMVDTDRILPVLDGLDEMDAPDTKPVLAGAALERLNRSPWRSRAVVVACRSRVYAAICELRPAAGLHYAITVTLQPFSAEDIYFHLERYREGLGIAEAVWAPVTDQLDQAPSGVLATALRTPWLLSLAATALGRGGSKTAVELGACRDTADIRELLFASLIPAAVDATSDTGRTRDYTEEHVERWLRALAQQLEQRRTEHSGGSQIALDQIWQLAGTRTCRALHAVLGGLTWLATGVAVVVSMVVARHTGHVMLAIWFGLGIGAVAGVVTGLWYGLAAVRADIGLQRSRTARRFAWRGNGVPRRFAWRVPGRSRWRRGLKRGLTVGLLAAVVALALCFRGDGSIDTAVLAWFLALSFAVALVFGLVRGLETTSEERLALGQDADRVIHDDLVSALIGGLVWLAVFATFMTAFMLYRYLKDDYLYRRAVLEYGPDGKIVGFHSIDFHPSVIALLKDWHPWLSAAIAGLAIGLLLALLFASLSAVASGRYAIASLLFGFTGKFPRRPARLLEWARETGLLRVTGIAYQFRHDTYQQWLCGPPPDQRPQTDSIATQSRTTAGSAK